MFLAHIFFPMKYRLYELAMLLFAVYAACVHIRFMLIFLMILAPGRGRLHRQVDAAVRSRQGTLRL